MGSGRGQELVAIVLFGGVWDSKLVTLVCVVPELARGHGVSENFASHSVVGFLKHSEESF